jgi:tetratricopeptide (TPR) repeat protein
LPSLGRYDKLVDSDPGREKEPLMNQVGRNDPCPCGSGIKYKKCCMSGSAIASKALNQDDEIRALAYKNMSDEKWSEAIALFKSILDKVTDQWLILEAIAACYDGLDNYLAAAEFYEKALAVCPDNRRLGLLYRLGVSRGCAQRFEKAADAFRQYLQLEPDRAKQSDAEALLRGVESLAQGRGKPSEFFVTVQLQRAFSELDAESYEAAAIRLERIISADPENAAIFYNLGVVYTYLKREDAALASFEKSVELDPNIAQSWYNMGQIYLIQKRDFSRALHCFDRAAAIRPNYIGAQHQRGVAYELLGDPHKAIECWERTLDLDPGNKQAKDNIERVRAS